MSRLLREFIGSFVQLTVEGRFGEHERYIQSIIEKLRRVFKAGWLYKNGIYDARGIFVGYSLDGVDAMLDDVDMILSWDGRSADGPGFDRYIYNRDGVRQPRAQLIAPGNIIDANISDKDFHDIEDATVELSPDEIKRINGAIIDKLVDDASSDKQFFNVLYHELSHLKVIRAMSPEAEAHLMDDPDGTTLEDFPDIGTLMTRIRADFDSDPDAWHKRYDDSPHEFIRYYDTFEGPVDYRGRGKPGAFNKKNKFKKVLADLWSTLRRER